VTVFRKSLITLGLAALGFYAAVVVSVLVFMNSLYYEINMKGLGDTAKTLMTVYGKDRLTEIFAANDNGVHISLPLGADEIYRLTLIDASGNVLWDSHVTDRIVNHIDREEVIAALEGREGSSRRESLTTGIRHIYHALPVFDSGGNPIGVFRLSAAVPGFGARVSPVMVPFLIFSCLFIIAAFYAIFIFSRSLSVSFNRLVKIVQDSAPLLSDPESAGQTEPEFYSLERTLKAMAAELNCRVDQARAQSRRLETILNGMTEAVFAMDSGLKLHLVNRRARELFNLENRDINSMSLLEATRSAELTEAAKKALLSGEPLETDLTFHIGIAATAQRMSANDSSRSAQQFQIFAAPLASDSAQRGDTGQTGANNSYSGVVIVLQEITRLVKLERVRRDFVANVSHELRTPIQLIKGFTETLLELQPGQSSMSEDSHPDDDSENKNQITHFLEIIRRNASTMENLTNDLLILADLENGLGNARDMEEENIAFLLNEAVTSTEPQAKRKQIEVIVNCSEDLKANLYGSFIIQALINLIDNGIKYSQPGSKIKVSACLEDDELILQVKDKGIGIPAEHIERIFERFYRVDKARKRTGGTGLGLSIVRHIALIHNGIAEAESHAGEGSVFRIRIPHKDHLQ